MTTITKEATSLQLPIKFIGYSGKIVTIPEQELKIPLFNGPRQQCGITLEDLVRAIKGHVNWSRQTYSTKQRRELNALFKKAINILA